MFIATLLFQKLVINSLQIFNGRPMNFKITLDDLVKVDSNISAILNREKLKEVHTLIKSKFDSVKNFANIIDFCPQTVYSWLNGKRNPKIIVVKRICKLLDIRLNDLIEKIICFNEPFRSFIQIRSFPIKGDDSLASLVGHSFGDGHISISFEYTNTCKELLDEVINNADKLSIKNVKVIFNRQPNKTPTLVFPKSVRDVLVCAGAPIGNKITSNFKFPDWIKNGNNKIKGAFIRALFDDEGNVSSNRIIRLSLSKRVDFVNNSRLFFEEIKSVLEDLGINRVIINKRKSVNGKNGETVENTLAIFGFFNFKKFFEVIKFNHPKKMKLLQKLVENPGVIRTRKGETKKKIIDLLENNSLTINEISKIFGLSWKTIWEHVKELEVQKILIKNKINNSRELYWSIRRPENQSKPFSNYQRNYEFSSFDLTHTREE